MMHFKTFLKYFKIRTHLLTGAMILTLIFLSLSPCSKAHAYLAEFTVTGLSNIGIHDDGDPDVIFTNDPDLYFVMGIFDNQYSPYTDDTIIIPYQSNPQTKHLTWDFQDITISRTLDQSYAYFYFALIDEDPLEADDLLGDHWVSVYNGSEIAGTYNNNNLHPFSPNALPLSLDTEGGSDSAGNFMISYEAKVVPIPGAVWLLGSGLLAMVGLRRRSNK